MSDAISEIRSFNRFYTRWVGALDRHHLGSSFSLAEARVLYELAHQPGVIARDLVECLGLDAGYLSRMLKRFEADGLIQRQRSKADSRASALFPTAAGLALFEQLDRKAAAQVGDAIAGLSAEQRERLTSAMGLITHLASGRRSVTPSGLILREPRSGDYGWAIERHGVIYATEFGWGTQFEGLVAELFGSFATHHKPERERCWIAELDGKRAGCVFVVEREPEVAQLRCLLVEPSARGHGVGRRLVEECLRFARSAGYRRMMLWTNKGLDSARKIYESVGFRLIGEQPHEDFGVPLVGQNWEMPL